jgi:hypothetical protein
MVIGVIFLSLVIGIAYAVVLYYKEEKSSLTKKQRTILSFIRATAIALICIVISALFFKNSHIYKEKPIIVIVQDNSKSLIFNKDSVFYRTEYPELVNDLSGRLKQIADVQQYSFDSSLREGIDFSFSGQQTNISAALDEILIRYENRNIGGIILATDGIVNSGYDISNYADKFHIPIHTIALGDTIKKPDLFIKNITYNKTVVYDNRFPVEVLVQANQLNNEKSVLQIIQDGQEIHKKDILINSHRFSEQNTFMVHANQKGFIKLDVILKPIDNEANVLNNQASVIVEVIDKKEKICILYAISHPDISAIKSVIEDIKTFEVDAFHIKDFSNSSISEYDAFILFQIPSKLYKSTDLLNQLTKLKVPIVYTVGLQTDVSEFNKMLTGIQILSVTNQIQESIPSLNQNFTSFLLSEETRRAIDRFPPLITHFAQYKLNDIVQTFLYQKIGNVITTNPLIAFNQSELQNIGIIIGEGLYKWKIYSYIHFQNHILFNEVISKLLHVVIQKANREQLRVFHKDVYFDNESVIFTAETYNISMEMLSGIPIILQISKLDGNILEMQFSSLLNNYRLEVGTLEPGEYKWTASTTIDRKNHQVSGSFFVEKLNIEAIDLTARHYELLHLSNKTNGIFAYPNKKEIDTIYDYLQSDSNFKTIEYFVEKFDELISLRFLAFFIICLFSIEWALRKYFGYY